MKKELIYIIEDDDTGEVYAFKYFRSAVTRMFEYCIRYGAILYVPNTTFGIKRSFIQYVTLSSIYPTEEEQLAYLFNCSLKTLNEIFESYWVIYECEIEDS